MLKESSSSLLAETRSANNRRYIHKRGRAKGGREVDSSGLVTVCAIAVPVCKDNLREQDIGTNTHQHDTFYYCCCCTAAVLLYHTACMIRSSGRYLCVFGNKEPALRSCSWCCSVLMNDTL